MRTMHPEDTIQRKPCQVKRYINRKKQNYASKNEKGKSLKNNAGTAFLNLSRRKFLKLCADTHSFRAPEPHENKTDSGGKRTLRMWGGGWKARNLQADSKENITIQTMNKPDRKMDFSMKKGEKNTRFGTDLAGSIEKSRADGL